MTEKSTPLTDRLRGIYNVDVNDGAGELNGREFFTREFKNITPINLEAATRIEQHEDLLDEVEVALDDWLNIFAPESCNSKRVGEAFVRIKKAGGEVAYINYLQQKIKTLKTQTTNT